MLQGTLHSYNLTVTSGALRLCCGCTPPSGYPPASINKNSWNVHLGSNNNSNSNNNNNNKTTLPLVTRNYYLLPTTPQAMSAGPGPQRWAPLSRSGRHPRALFSLKKPINRQTGSNRSTVSVTSRPKDKNLKHDMISSAPGTGSDNLITRVVHLPKVINSWGTK